MIRLAAQFSPGAISKELARLESLNMQHPAVRHFLEVT
jgi:hypothetical protein